MKILFDECTPKPLKRIFKKHFVLTAQHMGWSGMSNGALLFAAEAEEFDVVVTCDKSMFKEQSVIGRNISVIELPTNREADLFLLTDKILATVNAAQPGNYYRIST